MNSSNSSTNQRVPLWPYGVSPWDLLRDCQTQPPTPSSQLYCTMSTILGVVSAYLFPIIGTFGVFNNLQIVYIMLFRMLPHQASRQFVYLTCLAIADAAYLIIFGWFWIFPAKGLPYASGGLVYFFTFNKSDFSCRLHRFLQSIASFLTTSFMVAVTVDRTLTMFMPFRFRNIQPRAAWVTCFLITLLGIALTLPFLILMGHFMNSRGLIGCWLIEPNIFWHFLQMLYCNTGILQSLILIISNIALILKLRQARDKRLRMMFPTRSTSKVSTEKTTTSEISACVTILIISGVFFATSLPQNTCYILAFLTERLAIDKSPVRFYFNLADILWQSFFIQESLNWVIYLARMKAFRIEVFRIIGRKSTPTEARSN